MILNAADLSETDFACVTSSSDRSAKNITQKYDEKEKTFTLSADDGKTDFDLDAMRDIHFGNSKKDLNLCNPSSNFYRVDDIAKIKANLNSNTTSFDLSSKTPDAVKDITM